MARHSLFFVWTLSLLFLLCKCHALNEQMLCRASKPNAFRGASRCPHYTKRAELKGETFEEEAQNDDAANSIQAAKQKVEAAEKKIQEILKSATDVQTQVRKAEAEEIKNGNAAKAKSEEILKALSGTEAHVRQVQSAMQKMDTKLNEAKGKAKSAFDLATAANAKMTQVRGTLDAAEKLQEEQKKKDSAAKAVKDAEEAQKEAEKANSPTREAKNALTELQKECKALQVGFCKVTISRAANVVFHAQRYIQDNFSSAYIMNSRMDGALRDIHTILKDMNNEEMKRTVQTQLEAATKSQSTASVLYKNMNEVYNKARKWKEQTTKFWKEIPKYTSLESIKGDCDEAEIILKETEDGKKITERELIKFNEDIQKVNTANGTAFTNFYADKVLMSIHYANMYAQEAAKKRQAVETSVTKLEALQKGEMGEYREAMRHAFESFQQSFSLMKQNAEKTISASVNAEKQKEKAMKAVKDVSTATDAAVMERHANDAKDASIAASLHETEAFTHKIKMNDEYFKLFKTSNIIKITSSAAEITSALRMTKRYAEQIRQVMNESDAAIKCVTEMSGAVQAEHKLGISEPLKSAQEVFANIKVQDENAQGAFYKVQASKNKMDGFVREMQRYGTCPVTSSKLFNATKIVLREVEKEASKSKGAHENVLTSKEKIISAIEEAEKIMGVTHAGPINKMSPQKSKDSNSLKNSCAAFVPLTPIKEDEKSGDGNEIDGHETVETTRPVKNSDVMIHPYHALLFSLMVVLCTVVLNAA